MLVIFIVKGYSVYSILLALTRRLEEWEIFKLF